VVAAEDSKTVAASSTLFTGDLRADPARADWRRLPVLRVAPDDPAAGYLATVSSADSAALVEQLRQAPVQTVEVTLRLAHALADAGEARAAHELCDALQRDDPWEWRAAWAHGVACLAEGRPEGALDAFTDVYGAAPGELAAKLGLGVAHELGGAPDRALRWYEVVAVTDSSYTTAAFGLARCRLATGDRGGALAAYDLVPASSSAHEDAQIAKINLLAAPRMKGVAEIEDLRAAAATLEPLSLDPERRARLTIKILLAALKVVLVVGTWPGPDDALLGVGLDERDLRAGIERSYRTIAHLTEDTNEPIHLVDLANDIRPRTWT
jgi:serine/threonine-protein kinase PknG